MPAPDTYLRAVHYFGDAGIANFWSTFTEADVAEDLERIRGDGFNAIILVLPWAAFQPWLDPPGYSDAHLDRLRGLIGRAGAADLGVILRVGYYWERDHVQVRTAERYRILLRAKGRDGVEMAAAWVDYHRRLAEASDGIEFAFLSWEDPYWPMLRGPTERDAETRRRVARASGFRDATGIERVPRQDEPAYRDWLRFFDRVVLNQLTELAAPAWTGIGLRFEHRVDGDPWIDETGARQWYQYDRERSATPSDVIYYHPQHSDPDHQRREVHDGAAALVHLESVLRANANADGESVHPFVDQFNFASNNPTFSHFSAIEEGDIPSFIVAAGPIFRRWTSGYGVWGFRDWVDDQLTNGRFELETPDWTLSRCRRAAPGLSVAAGSRIDQRLFGARFSAAQVELEIGEVVEPLTLQISLERGTDADSESLVARTPGRYTVTLGEVAGTALLKVRVEAGAGRIDRVSLYSHTYTNGCYGRDWSERPAVAALRRLNDHLSQATEAG